MSSFVSTSPKKASSCPQGLRNKEQQAVNQRTTSFGKGPISWFSRLPTALGFSRGGPSSRHSDMLEKSIANFRKRVELLKDIQSECDELEAEYFKERAALEAKYHKLCEPLYTKRYEIVNGEDDNASDDFGVAGFWLKALKTDEFLAEEITEQDVGALIYLKDIKWYRIDDPKGFNLEFHFDKNPYFKNLVLTKTYHVLDKDEFTHEKAFGTKIEWYPGKCLTQKILDKNGKRRGTEKETCESFFNFFNNEEALNEDQMERDYDIGWTIRSEIIPHAVSWYTGEAAWIDESNGVKEDKDEEEDDKEKETDDEDDEEEEDEHEEEDAESWSE